MITNSICSGGGHFNTSPWEAIFGVFYVLGLIYGCSTSPPQIGLTSKWIIKKKLSRHEIWTRNVIITRINEKLKSRLINTQKYWVNVIPVSGFILWWNSVVLKKFQHCLDKIVDENLPCVILQIKWSNTGAILTDNLSWSAAGTTNQEDIPVRVYPAWVPEAPFHQIVRQSWPWSILKFYAVPTIVSDIASTCS